MNEDIEIPAGHACHNPGRYSYLAGPTLGGKFHRLQKGHDSTSSPDPIIPVTQTPYEKSIVYPPNWADMTQWCLSDYSKIARWFFLILSKFEDWKPSRKSV